MEHKHTNRLIKEKSPYLLQHAHNPVDWYPWGEEAFAKAKAEDKPVFLSIGYSTCHWCHVMERESFEDGAVAEMLNTGYVAVKVDREERPDIDHIYMAVCQALTGSGGWPLTVIMTSDKKPFFAGTYFPKEGKWGRPGLMELLGAISKNWRDKKSHLLAHADQVTGVLSKHRAGAAGERLSPEVFEGCYNQFLADFSPKYGGFGPAPKFPSPHGLMFLLRYWRRTGTAKALEMAAATLTAMRRGGIYDHLGGGFARYSTDERWLVPHFEKMSYDNSLLCHAYLEAYQCTKNEDYARVAEEIIGYVRRDMTGPEGEFYSAEDADSEGVEGKFYLWTRQEVLDSLGPDAGELFCECYDVTDKGNFENANILNFIEQDWPAVAARRNMTLETLASSLAASRQQLYNVRERRVHPFKDDKVLTAWNGLMISALAKAARVLDRPEYAQAAQKALAFIEGNLVRPDGRLLARYRDGEAAHLALVDDYANLVWALLELFETSQQPELLARADHWSRELLRLFWDNGQGGFYLYGADSEQLITRPKEIYDGATPSGNSVAAYVLLRLAGLTDNKEFAAAAEKLFAAFAAEIKFYPKAYTFLLIAGESLFTPLRRIVIAGPRHAETVRRMWRTASQAFIPDALVLLGDALEEGGLIAAENIPPADGKAAAYICENFACQQPITDPGRFEQALAGPPRLV